MKNRIYCAHEHAQQNYGLYITKGYLHEVVLHTLALVVEIVKET